MYDLGNTEGAKTLIPYKRGQQKLIGIGHNGGPIMVPDLQSQQAAALHRSLLGHYIRELDIQRPWRVEKALDGRFYDNDPWSEHEKAVLRARGQLATNFNVVATTINWMIGTERRGRIESKVIARRKEDTKSAARKSELMKYLDDANLSAFHFSKAYADSLKMGEGWMESGWQNDDDGEPIYDRAESWRNILRDSLSRDMDYSADARYLFRMKWVDEDLAHAMFPNGGRYIDAARTSNHSISGSLDQFGDEFSDYAEEGQNTFGNLNQDGFTASPRSRVRLIECWFRKPLPTNVMVGGQFAGEIFDADSPGHTYELDTGKAEMQTRVKLRMHVAIFTHAGMLHFQESPYRHNKFSLTPIWCYRKDTDGESYGITRNIRDLQTQINYAGSKVNHVLATNKTIMDKGAVDDLDEFEEEVSRADSIIVKNPGKELVISVDRELASAHLDLMSRNISMVQQVSGVTDESMGRTTNARSGIAIEKRQDQGGLVTAEPLDNLSLAKRLHGEKKLSLTEQFMTEEKQFRITNSRGVAQHVAVNDGLPENDITRSKADFVITEQALTATARQANFETSMAALSQIIPVAPELGPMLLDLVYDMSDVPNREEIVKRIRQMTGMKDPDADPNEPPSPEEQAMDAQKQEQQEIMKRAALAKVALDESGAALKAAQAEKAAIDGETSKAGMVQGNLDAFLKAMEGALALLQVPQAAPVADKLLRHAATGTAPGPQPVPSGQAPLPPPQQPGTQPGQQPQQGQMPGQSLPQAQPQPAA